MSAIRPTHSLTRYVGVLVDVELLKGGPLLPPPACQSPPSSSVSGSVAPRSRWTGRRSMTISLSLQVHRHLLVLGLRRACRSRPLRPLTRYAPSCRAARRGKRDREKQHDHNQAAADEVEMGHGCWRGGGRRRWRNKGSVAVGTPLTGVRHSRETGGTANVPRYRARGGTVLGPAASCRRPRHRPASVVFAPQNGHGCARSVTADVASMSRAGPGWNLRLYLTSAQPGS